MSRSHCSPVLQWRFGILPPDAVVLSDNLAFQRFEGTISFFNSGGPVFRCYEDDKSAVRLGQGMLSYMKLAGVAEIARAFGVNRSTVTRNRKRYIAGGANAFGTKRGPRGAYRLKGACLETAQRQLDAGASVKAAARAAGVSDTAVHCAIKRGDLRRRSVQDDARAAGSQPSERSQANAECVGGVAVRRREERRQAWHGQLDEAPARFEAADSVVGGGVLLAIPWLLREGLVSAAEPVCSLSRGYFGLRSVLLVLAIMTLLRITCPERLKRRCPGDLGLLVGLDRLPEMKTLRRKINELAASSAQLRASFTEHWSRSSNDALAYLLVDGHVRPYHGGKWVLPKTFVARRRLCMPATTDNWVLDADAQPWFVVTAAANDHLLSVFDRDILPEVRRQVGSERRVTLIFDREGWSPKTFRRWQENGFDIITYRKNRYEAWPEAEFAEVAHGDRFQYRLAERETGFGPNRSLLFREIRRLCANGHQTSIITTLRDLPAAEVAWRMFGRWRQENFFRYMRHEFGIDHLCTYAAQPADPERMTPNPQLARLRKQRRRLENASAVLSRKIARARDAGAGETNAAEAQRRALETRIRELSERAAELPKKRPVGEVLGDPERVVRLDLDHKSILDIIKMVAYRAETAMLEHRVLVPSRHVEEGRAFLSAAFQTAADLVPDENAGTLTVRLHSMARPQLNSALRCLCAIASQQDCRFPGTELKMIFECVGNREP